MTTLIDHYEELLIQHFNTAKTALSENKFKDLQEFAREVFNRRNTFHLLRSKAIKEYAEKIGLQLDDSGNYIISTLDDFLALKLDLVEEIDLLTKYVNFYEEEVKTFQDKHFRQEE
jgi:hypothetical protein